MKILNTMIHQNNYKISVINYQMFKFEGQFFFEKKMSINNIS